MLENVMEGKIKSMSDAKMPCESGRARRVLGAGPVETRLSTLGQVMQDAAHKARASPSLWLVPRSGSI